MNWVESALLTWFVEKKRQPVRRIEFLQGGANSEVAKVLTEGDNIYFVKRYLHPENDFRNRLETEFQGLKFLWNHKIRHIPEPIFFIREKNLAVYSFLPGRHLAPEEINKHHLKKTASFFSSLQKLASIVPSHKVKDASDSCLTIQTHIDLLNHRIEPLLLLEYPPLQKFLISDLLPGLNMVKNFVTKKALETKLDLNVSLLKSETTLSPSDVGFHNILYHAEEDQLYYIDFEYFGWDDPAKMICDFILQPGRPLPTHLVPFFVHNILLKFPFREILLKRIQVIFLLVGIKWCLIMLNPFLPNRKRLYGNELETIWNNQLKKAKLKFITIQNHYHTEDFLQWGK